MTKKLVQLQTTKQLLKCFPNLIKDIEPVRTIGNTIWHKINTVEGLKLPKEPLYKYHSTKKVLYCISYITYILHIYCILFSNPAVYILLLNGKRLCYKSVYYRDAMLKKLKTYYQTRRSVSGFRHVHLLLYNASSHTSELVKQVLKSEKVTLLPHPPYSPDPAPCNFFPFSKTKTYLFVVTSPGKPMTQPSVNASEVYQN